MNDTTDFGYQQVRPEEKTAKVNAVFSSVAAQYDVMNDIMSFQQHHWWKRRAVSACSLRPGQCVLDLAGGTGDLARLIRPQLHNGQLYIADLTYAMLQAGRTKLINQGYLDIVYLQAAAEALPFADNSFDCVTLSFGLRNMTDKTAALSHIYRCLKPGGRLVILEFSHPPEGWFKRCYDWYSFNVLPRLGQLIAQDAASYRYLAESIRKHPTSAELSALLTSCGFQHVSAQALSHGIVALHKGFKC